jgi:hypothetical protein
LPGRSTFPETLKTFVPGDFSVPIAANHSGPSVRIEGTFASVSTLLMSVGDAYRPSTAGNGGRSRGWPRNPSSEDSSAVSSPQMYAPAPRWITTSSAYPEPSTESPNTPLP